MNGQAIKTIGVVVLSVYLLIIVMLIHVAAIPVVMEVFR